MRTDLLAADIELERPCPICVPPWTSRTLIEWIRHVRRHDDIESKTDRNFMQEKCVELLNTIDTELLLVQPSTESLRSRRSVKRARDAAEIGSDQSLPRKRRSERAVGMNNDTGEARQQNGHMLLSHIQSPGQARFRGPSTIQHVEPSQSIIYPVISHHDSQDLSIQHIDMPSTIEQITRSKLDSTLTNNEKLSVESGGDMDPCLFDTPEFSLPVESEVFPAIYHAMNYSLSGSGI